MSILGAALVIFNSQQCRDFLGVAETFGLDWTVGKQEHDQCAEENGSSSNAQVEDSPTIT